MAIVIDTVVSNGGPSTSEASTGSFAVNNVAGTSLMTIAIHGFRNRTVSSVTYNGVAMTSANARAVNGAAYYTEIWYLLNPATGSHNVVWTLSGTDAPTFGVVTFTGGATSNILGNVATNTGTSASPSASITTGTANSIIFSGCYINNTSASTATTTGTNQTKRWGLVDSKYGSEGSCGSTQTTTTAGSYTNSYSITSTAWTISAAEFKESATVVTFIPQIISII